MYINIFTESNMLKKNILYNNEEYTITEFLLDIKQQKKLTEDTANILLQELVIAFDIINEKFNTNFIIQVFENISKKEQLKDITKQLMKSYFDKMCELYNL